MPASSLIIRDVLIVTSRRDAPRDCLDVRIASIGIAEGRIIAVGTQDALRQKCPHPRDEIDGMENGQIRYLAMPGFVDAHNHSRQMAVQAFWESGWGDKRSKPQTEREMVDIFWWFLLESVKAGVTFVCDWPEQPHAWTPAPLDEAMRQSGLRGCIRALLPHDRDEPLPDVASALENLRQAASGLDERTRLAVWIPEEDNGQFNDAVLAWLGQLQRRACHLPVSFQMHLAETKGRKEACRDALARLLGHGLVASVGAARTVFVHTIWIDREELKTLIEMKDRVGVVTCPKFSEGRLAPIKELLEGGVPVGLGSDVAVPDPFALIRKLLSLHRSREKELRLSFAEAFHMATLGGARLFGLDEQIGSIEEGKEADIVLVRNPAAIDPTLFAPSDADDRECGENRARAIERLFRRNVIRREHVDRVILRGRIVVDRGVLVSREHEAAIERAGKTAALAILKRLRARTQHSP